MGFFEDVADAFRSLDPPVSAIFGRRRAPRPPPTRRGGRLPRQAIVARFAEWCREVFDTVPPMSEPALAAVHEHAVEDFLGELEPWHVPYMSYYRDVLLEDGERSGYLGGCAPARRSA